MLDYIIWITHDIKRVVVYHVISYYTQTQPYIDTTACKGLNTVYVTPFYISYIHLCVDLIVVKQVDIALMYHCSVVGYSSLLDVAHSVAIVLYYAPIIWWPLNGLREMDPNIFVVFCYAHILCTLILMLSVHWIRPRINIWYRRGVTYPIMSTRL